MTAAKNGRNLKNGFINSMQERILSGELKPGDRLPPERELALEYVISRGSVNQAILDLERMGFIHVVPRKGTYVTEYLEKVTPETLTAIMSYDSTLIDPTLFRDLMDMRMLIERECVRLSCLRINTRARKLIDECVERIYTSAAEVLPDAIYEFHKAITKVSCNSAYAMIFQSFEKMLKNMMELHYSDADERKSCIPIYSRLAAAIGQGDTQEADAMMVKILDRAWASLSPVLTSDREDV